MQEGDYRRYIGYYIALVHEIDAHINSILETLDKEGLAENTIVVYSADHGDFVETTACRRSRRMDIISMRIRLGTVDFPVSG